MAKKMTDKRKIEILAMTDDELNATVKIQGTPYDRKRKFSATQLKEMAKLFKKGKTVAHIAQKMGLNYTAVRYNVDPVFKKEFNEKRDGKHTGKTHITVKDRVAYKRSLVAAGSVVA